MVQTKFSRAEFCEWAKGSRSVKVYKYESVISKKYSFQLYQYFQLFLERESSKKGDAEQRCEEKEELIFFTFEPLFLFASFPRQKYRALFKIENSHYSQLLFRKIKPHSKYEDW